MKRILLCFALLTYGFTGANAQSFEITPTDGFLKSASPDLELTGSSAPQIRGKRLGGSLASPYEVSTNSTLLDLIGAGYNGSSFLDRASISMRASEFWTGSANGTDIRFSTTAIGSTFLQEGMRLTGIGNLGIGVVNPEAKLHVDGGIKLNVNNSTHDFVSFKILNTSTLPGMRFLSTGGTLLGGLGHGSGITQLWRGASSNEGLTLNDDNYVGLNNFNPTVPFHVNYSNSISNSSTGAMVIGEFSGYHLNFDRNEINAWNNTTGSTLYFNFWSEGDVQIGNSPNGAGLDVNGYTNLGNGAPKIKMKKLTGTTASTDGSSVNIAHGIGNSDKILAVDIAVEASENYYYPASYEYRGNQILDFAYDDTNIIVINHIGAGFVISKPIKILVTYEE